MSCLIGQSVSREVGIAQWLVQPTFKTLRCLHEAVLVNQTTFTDRVNARVHNLHRTTTFMQSMAVQAWYRQLLLLVFIFALNVSLAESIDDPALPPGLFYPFGADVGDVPVTQGDDVSIGPIALSSDFVLHNKTYSQLYVSDYILCCSCSHESGYPVKFNNQNNSDRYLLCYS